MKIKKSLFTTEIEFTVEELINIPALSPLFAESLTLFIIKILKKLEGKNAPANL